MTNGSFAAGMKQNGFPNAALLGHFWDRIERGSLQLLKWTLTIPLLLSVVVGAASQGGQALL